MKKDDLFVYKIDSKDFVEYNRDLKGKVRHLRGQNSKYYNKTIEYHFLSKTDEIIFFGGSHYEKCIKPDNKIFKYGGKLEIINNSATFYTTYKILELKFSHIVISYDVPLIPLDYILFKDDFLYSVSKDLKLYRGEKQSLTQLEHLDLLTFAPIYIAKEFGEKLLKEKNQDLFSYNEIKDYIVNGNTEGLKSLICKEGQEYLPTLFFDYTI